MRSGPSAAGAGAARAGPSAAGAGATGTNSDRGQTAPRGRAGSEEGLTLTSCRRAEAAIAIEAPAAAAAASPVLVLLRLQPPAPRVRSDSNRANQRAAPSCAIAYVRACVPRSRQPAPPPGARWGGAEGRGLSAARVAIAAAGPRRCRPLLDTLGSARALPARQRGPSAAPGLWGGGNLGTTGPGTPERSETRPRRGFKPLFKT